MTGDEIGRTAVGVRAIGRTTVHRLFGARTAAGSRLYRTCCGEELSNVAHHAVLTTRAATCARCATTPADVS